MRNGGALWNRFCNSAYHSPPIEILMGIYNPDFVNWFSKVSVLRVESPYPHDIELILSDFPMTAKVFQHKPGVLTPG
jgi:hypothetical protein